MFNKSKLNIPIEKSEFFNLKVNVFKNRNNGQLMITLPKKKLNSVPSKINIKLPKSLFKKSKEDK